MIKEKRKTVAREFGSGCLTERNGAVALIIYAYQGRSERLYTPDELVSWEFIGSGTRIYDNWRVVSVKNYELTFKNGECVTCTVENSDQSNDLEALFFSGERRSQ